MKPGTYKSTGNAGTCYWARLDNNGEIIANNLSDGPSVLTIRPSDAQVEVARCGTFRKR